MSLSLVVGWHWLSPADMFAVHSFSDKQSRKRSERSMPPLLSPEELESGDSNHLLHSFPVLIKCTEIG